jgi:hypothetical protein
MHGIGEQIMRILAAAVPLMLLGACGAGSIQGTDVGCARAKVMHLPGGVALIDIAGQTYQTLEDESNSVRIGSDRSVMSMAPTAEAWRRGPAPDAQERRRAVVIEEALPMMGRRIATYDETRGSYPEACRRLGAPMSSSPWATDPAKEMP